jgi:hypothetical protein
LRKIVRLLICAAALAPFGLYGGQPQTVIVFNDDGGWCWFQDERALVSAGTLLIGSVAAGVHDSARRGNIEVVAYDLFSGRVHSYLYAD